MSDRIFIVSGLPRSGTSMMMRMLVAGGMPALVDHVRKPDDDNPHGYYEFERVKKVKADSAWLTGAPGKVVKMVSLLLLDLPPQHEYDVVFMRRAMPEVLASQAKMLARLGKSGGGVTDADMARFFAQHLEKVERWLDAQPNIRTLRVDYADAVARPHETAGRVAQFVGRALDVEAMAAAVDSGLYRNRAQQ